MRLLNVELIIVKFVVNSFLLVKSSTCYFMLIYLGHGQTKANRTKPGPSFQL
jgi:hypothetical protein